MASVDIEISKFNISGLKNKLQEIPDDATRIAINNILARMCDPYVPFRNGPLSQSMDITPEGVRYTQPYARYQYYGEVYGPNIPIMEDGIVVGWFSPPGQKKHPTGRRINYSTDYHPLASSKWDEAMLRDHREEFEEEVTETIAWRLKQLNG